MSLAAAAPCAPTDVNSFADVSTADIFCTSANWLYNRGLVQGCQASGSAQRLFCPYDPLSRAQLARILERGAKFALQTQQSFDTVTALDGSAVTCQSPPLNRELHGRMVRYDFRLHGTATAAFDVTIESKRSVDGGTTYPAGNISLLTQTIASAGHFNVPLAGYGGFNAGTLPRVGFVVTVPNPAVITNASCEVMWLIGERIPL